MSTQKIGLIGLGAMGRGVAANLLAKHFEVIGYDVRPEMEDWMTQQGGSFVKELKDLAKQCQTVICFVVNDSQTEEVLFGKNGLANSLKPGNVFIACSTLPPAYVNALGKRLAEQGVELIDSPVTGGAAGAAKGSLTIISAGADSSTKRNKDEPGDRWLRMSRHHGHSNRQVQVARCTSTSAEKNDTKFTAS